MVAIRVISIGLLIWALGACSSNPAPIIDRAPGNQSTTANKPAVVSKPTATSKSAAKPSTNKISSDWRPDTYTVKKGDTLSSIGLEHGYDYKDIAQANDIKAPHTIKIGQVLKFNTLKEKPVALESKPVQENTDGVSTYAMGNESGTPATTASPATPQVAVLSEPKAIREPYSDEAFKKPLPATKAESEKPGLATKPANEIKAEIKPETQADAKSASPSNTESTDNFDWAWPTKGKIIANFNDAGNKGIDIAGNMGQSVNAAAPGKVIYSGSDLRGYGKLVIVKHNATYLSVYAHNSLILVKEGQQISRGQKIAEMGNTDSNTVKLHFEIRQQGKSVDPSKFLASN